MKEALILYFGIKPIEITFGGKLEVSIKDEAVHGLAWDEKSPFCEAMNNICKLVSIYVKADREIPEQFFLNENKNCIGEFRYEEIQKMLVRKNYTALESNLLMKLEFLR